MEINDDVLSMPKGWVVKYEDGTVITEYDRNGKETNWKKVPKKNIQSLSLKWYNKHWTITGKKVYIQFKRGSIAPGEAEHMVEERCIGYWDGPNKVVYRVDERTGQMTPTVE